MSVSKLESLPNEILIDLLEKYANGVDVLVTFRNDLNSRFAALVDQCQQLHFNFESIRKNHFFLCIGLLPDYRDRIQSLTLSDRDAPGQIDAFLSIFPIFDQFKQLRRLRLDFDGNTVEGMRMKNAMRSLLKTNIHTLSIKGKNAHAGFQSNHFIQAIFVMTTVRRLFLAVDSYGYFCNVERLISFNIEHLTIEGCGCTWNDLKIILKRASRLSYLNVRLVRDIWNSRSIIGDTFDIPPLTKLDTLILQFIQFDPLKPFGILVHYLHLMPNLRHLEIIDKYGQLLDVYAWRKLLETSLPLLSRLVLKIGLSYLAEHHLRPILTSFQTPFWIEEEILHVYVITFEYVDDDIVLHYHPINSRFDLNDRPRTEERPCPCWTIPQRCVTNNRLLMGHLTTLSVSGISSILPTQFELNNVKHLKVDHLNLSLFRWITTYINLSNLTELMIPHLETENDQINSLLAQAENISSLQINFNQLFSEHSARIGEYNSIRRLDISVAKHPFRQEDILVLARLFPSIEHLRIYPINLDTVPLLNVYLPKIHSLTLKFLDSDFRTFGSHLGRPCHNPLRYQKQFLFQCTDRSITIWIDEAAFKDPFWRWFLMTHQQINRERPLKSPKTKCLCC